MRWSRLATASALALASIPKLPGETSTVCPFLNAATAAGFLKTASITVIVTPSTKGKDDAVCEFKPIAGDLLHLLHVEVATMAHPKQDFPSFLQGCGSHAEPIRGIGSQAVACSGTLRDGEIYDEILSRVRERSLLVRVSTSDKKEDAAALREESLQAADEVSGNLF